MTILEICSQAEEIAQKYNPDGLSPFPFEKIRDDRKDFDIFSMVLADEISGAILYSKKAKKFNILLNISKPKTRQYFTTAHELGHYFLHPDLVKTEEALIDGDNYLDGGNVLYRLDNTSQNILETEANNFAASLIMPTNLVTSAWKTVKNIEELAKLFNVSSIAMSIRLERLGLTKQ